MEGSGPPRGRCCFCLGKGRAEPDEAEQLAALLSKLAQTNVHMDWVWGAASAHIASSPCRKS